MSIYRATKSAAEYRAKAHQHYQDAEDSFDRCDTDGFLSQWASGVSARIDEALACLAENDGKATVRVLADLDGNRVNARPMQTRFGTAWGILDGNGKIVEWASYCPKNAKTLAKKGYQEIMIEMPCVVMTYEAGSMSVGVRYWPEEWLGR